MKQPKRLTRKQKIQAAAMAKLNPVSQIASRSAAAPPVDATQKQA